jgi:release factor glutamine methyltransferase
MTQSDRAPQRTVGELLKLTATFFAERGVPTPRLDAEVLLAHVLDVPRIQLYVQHDRPLTDVETAAYRELVKGRAQRKPVQHLVGKAEFWSMTFEVAPGVFCPRPDTETLVGVALRGLQPKEAPLRVLELCAGTGCIGLAIAKERPAATVDQVELVAETAACARRNGEKLGFASRARVVEGSLYAPLEAGMAYDAIVSNPPYIPRTHVAEVSPEALHFEDHRALFGGDDGLEVVRPLVGSAPEWLKPGGIIAIEIDSSEVEAVRGLMAEAGLTDIGVENDLGGRPRVVFARKPQD